MIRVAVGIIKHQGKLLVAERPDDKPYSGYWEFPGGKIEPQETPIDALKRELLEELGIQVITAKPWFTHHHTYPDKSVILEMWLVTEFHGEPHGKEKQRLKWVTISEMLQLNLLEGNLPILDKIRSLLNNPS